ncbi:MAG: VOC family protein [Acidobacteriota bacterium]|jgi:catechol 2,3-dioxygenase-like lactoylglutathione lyase family enzyme
MMEARSFPMDNGTIAQVRVARPTDRLEDLRRFYCEDLGLPEIGGFGGSGHHGYTGLMVGLPGADFHLEFTQHEKGSPCPAPTRDNLLVIYLPDRNEWVARIEKMRRRGHEPVPPENPYWEKEGATFEDPDGWRVVLMNTAGIHPFGDKRP